MSKKNPQNETDLCTRVMDEITQKKVAPKPRWYFTLKNLFLWATGIGLLLVGSLSVSIIIFIITGSPWELRAFMGESHLGYLMQFFPFLWLVSFIVFLMTADFIFSRTKGTYKHSAIKVSLVILLASIVLGSLLHLCKVSKMTDQILGKKAPKLYQTLEKRKNGAMHRPKKGRVMGVVQSVHTDGSVNREHFIIVHPEKEKELTIYTHELPQEKYELVQVGSKLLIIGKPAEKGAFHAHDIRNFEKIRKHIRKMLREKKTLQY